MSNLNDKAITYLEERWIDVVLPEALKVASEMAITGKSGDEISAAAESIAKAAIMVCSTLMNATEVAI